MEENIALPEVAMEQSVRFAVPAFQTEKKLLLQKKHKFKKLKETFYRAFLYHFLFHQLVLRLSLLKFFLIV